MLCKKLLLMLFIILTSMTIEAKVYLVSVGISDYPGSSMDLTLPADDAKTITALYSKNTDMKYCQLLDEDATISKVKTAMNKVFSYAKENDIVVFFFSGHGYEGGFCLYDEHISYEEIRKAMAKSKCKNKMIFADACFSGQIRTDRVASQSAINASKKANVMLFLSSRSDEVSLENSNMDNGFFTTYLHKGLRGSADYNEDKVITAKELFRYVHSNVIELSDDRQHPVMWGNFSDNMPVMKWK